MTDDLDLTQPIRDGLLAEPLIASALPNYGSNGKTIFTRRPVPSDAPYPMIVISPDVTVTDQDGIDHEKSVVIRDIAVYGKNEPAQPRRHTLSHRRVQADRHPRVGSTGSTHRRLADRGPLGRVDRAVGQTRSTCAIDTVP
jgi:hypothetical protein